MGMGTLDAYVADLEGPLLTNTREHYARKSQEWIETDSTPDYMIKVHRSPSRACQEGAIELCFRRRDTFHDVKR